MTGTADQIEPLISFLNPLDESTLRERDWQARHYAAMALEAITGEHRELETVVGAEAHVDDQKIYWYLRQEAAAFGVVRRAERGVAGGFDECHQAGQRCRIVVHD